MKVKVSIAIYWTLLKYDHWRLYIAATEDGMCYVGSPDAPLDELANWASKRYPNSVLIEDSELLKPYAKELVEYLSGTRQQFTIPQVLKGTPFQVAVWDALQRIPFGSKVSYTDIANELGRPEAIRAVGAAIGQNPNLITVPCHRVLGKHGALTGYRGGLDMKVALLELEREGSKTKE
jgi:methylated-DNA-[protein]-cysteine S-methyltransferase